MAALSVTVSFTRGWGGLAVTETCNGSDSGVRWLPGVGSGVGSGSEADASSFVSSSTTLGSQRSAEYVSAYPWASAAVMS